MQIKAQSAEFLKRNKKRILYPREFQDGKLHSWASAMRFLGIRTLHKKIDSAKQNPRNEEQNIHRKFKATKTDAMNNMRSSDLSETYTETKPHFTVEEN